MNTDLSNLYIEKVNSEHPLAVWMLNENVDYISLITDADRSIEDPLKWNTTNATVTVEANPATNTPIITSKVNIIAGDIPTTSTMDIECVTEYLFNGIDFDADYANFAIGFHFYVGSSYANSITYGYKYYDIATALIKENSETINLSSLNLGNWLFLSNTFANPTSAIEDLKPFIRINVSDGGGVNDYQFKINGFSLGQWSEDFNRESLGLIPQNISSDINLPSTLKAIEAYQYGGSNLNGYYLSSEKKLFAKNFGIPLVYGSSNSTKLYPNIIDNIVYPSLIFPGYGFLNERGKYNEYTAEMWVRINTDASASQKFFGPIASNDGLYVEGGFLTLVIGKNYGSHYVGEWFRPMLIQIRFIRNNISVVLNGEEVININFSESELELAAEYNETAKNQDWLGFYATEEVHPITIDSYALYSYSVPVEVAKRRWVWGQGVIAPETTNSSLNATTAFNDYSFSKYDSSYNYPDFASWRQGFFSNVETSSNFLKLPQYSLPTLSLDGVTERSWLDELQLLQSAETEKYFTFRPSIEWNNKKCYMYLSELSILNEPLISTYGIFETDGGADNEILFKIQNKESGNYFVATLDGLTLRYIINISGTLTTIATKTIASNTKFTAGIHIPSISLKPIAGINKFFTNKPLLTLSIGGDGVSTFSGKIYRFGLDAIYNNRKIADLYDSSGIFNSNNTTANTLMNHTSNYTVIAHDKYGIFFRDIAVAGYWQDYVPLSYFAKYVESYDGTKSYDLDNIQINLDYPQPIALTEFESSSTWTYQDLFDKYNDPVHLTYAVLDNSIYSGWEEYQDLADMAEEYYYYNTENNSLRSYISFQYITDGANNNLVDFTNFKEPRQGGVVDPEFLEGAWENTAYEVVDGTIVYPPLTTQSNKDVDFNNLAIVYHLDFKSDGILHHPINFRELQLASKVLERKQFTELGTRFGVPVYPYYKTGLYYDFKGKNPIATYKGTTPYLYLNAHSGWTVKGELSPYLDRGMSIPINIQQGLDTQVSAVQMWVRFNDKFFPTGETPFFSIVHKSGTYNFYIDSDESGQRGKIIGKDANTGAILTDVDYHINGLFVKNPYIINEEWSVIGIAFTELLDYSQYTGRLILNGPMTYNNISYYLATNLEQKQRIEVRTWGQVKENPTSILWDYWQNSFEWNTVKVVNATNVYAIDPSAIYDKYVGSSRIVVDDNIDGIWIKPDQIKVYNDMLWSTSTQIAV